MQTVRFGQYERRLECEMLRTLVSQLKVSSDLCRYGKGSEIYAEAGPADYIYQVIAGAVRSHKLLSDGRRQIGTFHLSSDIFGLENGDHHRFTAEAIVETSVYVVERQSMERLANSDPAIARRLLNMTTENLQHVEDQILLLGRKNAPERVAAFLLEMHNRLPPSDVMILPMNRRAIADYLGLTLETVSRELSEFQRKGYLRFLDVLQRQVVILNATALAELER